nr:unnamed protein product [Haemonchus contortus]
MIQKPQWDDRGETLLLNHDEIERAIKDQFEILEEYRSILVEIRQRMTNNELHESRNLRESLQVSLREIHELIEANNVTLASHAQKIEDLTSWIQSEFTNLQDSHNRSIDIIRAFLLKATQSTPSEHAISDSQPHVSDGGEGIEMLDQMLNPKNDDEMRSAREEEAKIIKRNGEFMEKVEEVDDEEANIVRRNDEIGNTVEVVDDQSVRRAQWQRRCATEREIQRKYAEVDDLEDLVTILIGSLNVNREISQVGSFAVKRRREYAAFFANA